MGAAVSGSDIRLGSQVFGNHLLLLILIGNSRSVVEFIDFSTNLLKIPKGIFNVLVETPIIYVQVHFFRVSLLLLPNQFREVPIV